MLTLQTTWNRYICCVCGDRDKTIITCTRCGITVCGSDHGMGYSVMDNNCYNCYDKHDKDLDIDVFIWVNNNENIKVMTLSEECCRLQQEYLVMYEDPIEEIQMKYNEMKYNDLIDAI